MHHLFPFSFCGSCDRGRSKCQHQIGSCHLAALDPVDLSLCSVALCFLSHGDDDLWRVSAIVPSSLQSCLLFRTAQSVAAAQRVRLFVCKSNGLLPEVLCSHATRIMVS